MSDAEPEMRVRTRRSFLVGGAAALTGLGLWRWLTTAETVDGVPWPLRRMLHLNESLAEGLLPPTRLAPTISADRIVGGGRVNGLVGLHDEIDPVGWKLHVGHENREPVVAIPLDEVMGLPRVDLVTEFKCVEGWSEVMRFGGVSFRDFVTRYNLGTRSGRAPDPEGNPGDLFRYVYLATPDESYYVGLDIRSALHPQTLLCDTINGDPLSRQHGAPVRVYLAVKYGYKSLKRLSRIRFQDQRPGDYWAERGYDWYAGL